MAKDPNGITEKAGWLAKIEPDLTLLNDINAGQRALLQKPDIYLPKDEYETDDGYAVRLRRASLRNFLLKLKRVAVATVLRKPIQVEGGNGFTDFVTNDGQNIQLFARNLLDAAWLEGMALVITDYPNTEGLENLAQEKAAGLKPYWQIIRRSQLLDAQSTFATQMIDGAPVYSAVLSELRFEAYAETEMGNEPVIFRYGLAADLDPQVVRWEQWAIRKESEKDKEGEWVVVDSGVINLPFIPVSPLYLEQEGFMRASLPLLETAHLNKHHFMVNSGKFNLLGIMGNPLMLFTGVDMQQENMSRASNIGLAFESPDADAKFVTLPPNLFPPIETALEGLERHLLNGAIQIFEQKNVAETEASKAMDREQNQSLLALSAQGLESCLNMALSHAAAFTGDRPATVTVNQDFSWEKIDPQDFMAWLQGHLSGVYTKETLLRKLEKAGFFEGLDLDIEAELERTS